MCLVLYWTKLGEYTGEELTTAYNELKEGRNPRKTNNSVISLSSFAMTKKSRNFMTDLYY